jgi:hypothetical protein
VAGPSVFFEDGTPVPPDQIASALQSGKAFVDRTQPVHMVDDTGVPVRVAAEELDKAIARGYAFEGADTVAARTARRERTTGGQLAATAAEGAARGATLGLSDVALTSALGDEYRQGALERREVNPLVAGVGEVGGTIAGTLATGGLGGALGAPARAMAGAGRLAEGAAMSGARALGYQGTTLAGRAATRAVALGAAGGVEGAMYGAGQAVSRAALEGTPITAEKVVASLGEGVLFGAVGGGGFGALTGALKRGPSAGGRALRGPVIEEADDFLLSASGVADPSLSARSGLGGLPPYRGSALARVGDDALAVPSGAFVDDVAEAADGATRAASSGASRGQRLGDAAARSRDALDGEAAGLGVSVGKGLRANLDAASEILPDAGNILRGKGRVSDSTRSWARKLADESALKAIGARGSDLRRLGKNAQRAEQEIGEIGQELLEYRFKTGAKQGEKLFQFAAKAEDFVDDLAHARSETGEALGALRSQIDEATRTTPGLTPDVTKYLRRVDDEVLNPLRGSVSPTVRKQARRVERELELLRERTRPSYRIATDDGLTPANDAAFSSRFEAEAAAEKLGASVVEIPPTPPTFAELDAFRRDLRSVFQPAKPTGGGLPAPVPEHAQYLERAERLLSDELDTAAETALAKMGRAPAEYKALKEQFRNLRQAEDVASKAAMQELGNRAVSPSDYATGLAAGLGALLTGNVGALALGGAGMAAHKLIRERGRSVVALLADRVARMDGAMGKAVPRLLGKGDDWRPGGGASTPSPRGGGPRPLAPANWMTTAEAVREYKRDPQAAQARLAAPVRAYADDYPQLAGAVQQQVAKTYDFLASKLPQPLTRAGASLTPELERTRYQAAQIARFSRYARGAVAPQEVIAELASGRIDRDGLEAIKTLYPETFGQLRTQVINSFSELKEPLPFQRRMLLSLVFDFNGDASLNPEFTSAVQQAHAEQIQQEAAQQASAPPPQLSDRLADGFATEGV